MAHYFATEMITNRYLMELGVVLIVGYFIHKSAGRRWIAPILVLAGLFGVTYAEGVLTDRGMRDIKLMMTGKFDAASARAKAIGGQAHKTSAGDGGQVNEHYRKRLDRKR